MAETSLELDVSAELDRPLVEDTKPPALDALPRLLALLPLRMDA